MPSFAPNCSNLWGSPTMNGRICLPETLLPTVSACAHATSPSSDSSYLTTVYGTANRWCPRIGSLLPHHRRSTASSSISTASNSGSAGLLCVGGECDWGGGGGVG